MEIFAIDKVLRPRPYILGPITSEKLSSIHEVAGRGMVALAFREPRVRF